MKRIRELGRAESLISQRGRRFSRSLRVTTDLDLLSRPGLLDRAVRHLIHSHPFLRARITDGCFVADVDLERLENVRYLHIDLGKSSSAADDVCWLLCERELTTGYFGPLLWSLVVLELAGKSAEFGHEFELILTLNHTISEGRNAHVLLLQLLDIVEHFWLNGSSSVGLREFQAEPSVEQLFPFESKPLEVASVPMPSYLDSTKAARRPTPPFDRLSDAWICEVKADARSPYAQLDELIEASREVCFKARRFTFSKRTKTRLLMKCKQERSSVTCVLVNMVACALADLDKNKRTLRQLAIVPITLRQFEPAPSDEFRSQLTMGYYGSALRLAKESSASEADFWATCRSDTARLFRMIDAREMTLETGRRRRGHLGASFVVSNLGHVPPRLPDAFALSEQRRFNVKQAYTEQEMDREDFYAVGPLSLFVSTCNGCLNVSVLYNAFVMNHAIADRFVELFVGRLNRVTDAPSQESDSQRIH